MQKKNFVFSYKSVDKCVMYVKQNCMYNVFKIIIDEISQAWGKQSKNKKQCFDIVKISLSSWLDNDILTMLKHCFFYSRLFSYWNNRWLWLNCKTLSWKVCMDLHDRSIRMNEAEMSMFSPFRPMLGQRGEIGEASE